MSYAQQDPQLTQFMFDKLSINPGYAGIGNELCVTGFYRQQWAGFEGAPETIMLNAHAPLAKINSGVGLTFYQDVLGAQENSLLRGHFSYHLKNIGTGKLGIGVSLGYLTIATGSGFEAVDLGDNVVEGSQGNNGGTFDASFGVYYKAPKFYAGLSATHLPEGDIKDVSIQTARHYYLMAGYDYAINADLSLQPNVLIKSDIASTQVDINLIGMYKNTFWFGVSGRSEAVAPMLGYRHELNSGQSAIRVGYSYDVTLTDINNYSSGSHEIMLNYCMKLNKPLPPQIYKNVRFL